MPVDGNFEVGSNVGSLDMMVMSIATTAASASYDNRGYYPWNIDIVYIQVHPGTHASL
ncbi:hypothetical protein SCLCIDRAFT_1216292 [Scleroderma citrinum Foug A]|uniref:Uncharacterized protein n=1 Tax=Scleroderma citrinum Foug A TaxID=1036808 RepID=A0A0C3DJV8_9AGAM|nr:hypothetical protein SCLCIDRAFT_1216292 [Scleroderma citrinum Foug A]